MIYRGLGGTFGSLLDEWAFDVTVRNVTAGAMCPLARVDSFQALGVAVGQKNKYYSDACSRIGAKFLPLVVSSAGGMHPDFVSLVERLAFLAEQRGSHGPRRWPLLNTKAFWLARFVAAVVMGMGARVQECIRVNTPEAAAISLHQADGVWSAHRWFMEV